MAKKVLSIVLISTLISTSLVQSGMELKHKKHLAIGAYSLLAAYSAKKAFRSLHPFIYKVIYKNDVSLLFPNVFKEDYYSSKELKFIKLAISAFNLVKFSLYGFLTYFSIKNIIEELKKKDKNKEEEKEKLEGVSSF